MTPRIFFKKANPSKPSKNIPVPANAAASPHPLISTHPPSAPYGHQGAPLVGDSQLQAKYSSLKHKLSQISREYQALQEHTSRVEHALVQQESYWAQSQKAAAQEASKVTLDVLDGARKTDDELHRVKKELKALKKQMAGQPDASVATSHSATSAPAPLAALAELVSVRRELDAAQRQVADYVEAEMLLQHETEKSRHGLKDYAGEDDELFFDVWQRQNANLELLGSAKREAFEKLSSYYHSMASGKATCLLDKLDSVIQHVSSACGLSTTYLATKDSTRALDRHPRR